MNSTYVYVFTLILLLCRRLSSLLMSILMDMCTYSVYMLCIFCRQVLLYAMSLLYLRLIILLQKLLEPSHFRRERQNFSTRLLPFCPVETWHNRLMSPTARWGSHRRLNRLIGYHGCYMIGQPKASQLFTLRWPAKQRLVPAT